MGNTYASLHVHVVFSTKQRAAFLAHRIEARVWDFLGGIARENGIKPVRIGGMPDHVHLALGLPPTIALSAAVKQIKGASSVWIKKTFPELADFAWQDGYGAFSVSRSNLDALVAYIENQREHHRKLTFQEEFVAFLEKHGVEYQPRYLWD